MPVIICPDGRDGPWQEPAYIAHGFLVFTAFSRNLRPNTELEIPMEAVMLTLFEQEQKSIV